MVCHKCGTQMSDDSLFCSFCGEKFVTAEPTPTPAPAQAVSQTEQQNYSAPQYQAPYQQYTYGFENTVSPDQVSRKNPIWAIVYNTVKSPLFITAACFLTFTFFLTIVSNVVSLNGLNERIWDMLWDMDLEIEFGFISGVIQGFDIYVFVSLIPSFVMNIGVWLTFFLVLCTRPGTSKTGGLTTIKVMLIIEEVFVWIAMFLVEIVLGFCLALMYILKNEWLDYEDIIAVEMLRGMFIAFLVIFPIIYTLYIIFYKSLRHSVNAAKYTLNTGKPCAKVSMFAAVMCFISGGATILSTLFSLIASPSILQVVASLSSATAIILFGAVMAVYRGKMKAAMAPAVQI